ncbi:MAG: chemotaxis protein CheC [Solirubrobacteraceae bacterium]|jgi:chemotaxis protein CheC|nr:chemotaxis protein CheC [Solirubrobacteraceae bacterium]
MSPFTTIQLDALRELANIGSGTAGTALSQMLGRSVDISVPNALVLPLAEAVEAVGPAEQEVIGVAIPLAGDMDAIVLLVFPTGDAGTLCGLLGVEAGTEDALSALGEIGNILGASYIGSLGAMTGLELDLTPPQTVTDMLAAIVATVLASRSEATDTALILDSELRVEGEQCSLSFLLLPEAGGVREILSRMGVEA